MLKAFTGTVLRLVGFKSVLMNTVKRGITTTNFPSSNSGVMGLYTNFPGSNSITPSTPTISNSILDQVEYPESDNTMQMDSVLRKRRLKMKKHKLRKRRKAQRALKKRLGKI